MYINVYVCPTSKLKSGKNIIITKLSNINNYISPTNKESNTYSIIIYPLILLYGHYFSQY